MSRSRRSVLTSLAGGGAFLAGCVENSDNPGESDNDTEPGSGSTTQLPDEEFPESCPEYGNVDQVLCYDLLDSDTDVDKEESPAVLEPSERSVQAEESIEFTLHNQHTSALETNFYNWRLDKLVDGEWYWIPPSEVPDPLMSIEPDESHTWSLEIDNSRIEDGGTVDQTASTGELTVEGLGGGHYAFRARGGFVEGHEGTFAFAATFEFDADPVELTPTSAVTEPEWDEETLVVETTRGNPEEDRLGAYTVERVDEPESETGQLITEQLFGNPQRRDAIALAEQYDANRVRLEEYNGTYPVFGSRSDGTFEYQGEFYEVSTWELDDT